ncbi:flagellar motor switch protein FliN [Treponema sp. R8-4-B8]
MEGNNMEMDKVNSLITDALSNATMKISVELGTTVKTVKEVFSMNKGTILELDKLAGEPVDVKANGVLIATGEIVIIDENFGVRIIDISDTSNALGKSESNTPKTSKPAVKESK